MEADRAREPGLAVVGWSLAAMELNQVFVPDRLGRTVLLAESPALRLVAAMYPP